jgi:adenylate kinase
MKRIILFGAPGAGKGTQADAIEENYSYKKISTGDLIRAEVAAGTEIGLKVKEIMEKGELVSDDTIIEILKRRLEKDDIAAVGGYIMDGFPRTEPQARELSRMDVDNEIAIYLNIIDEDVVVKRLLSRLTCSKCGAIFNLENEPPKKAGTCDLCGGTLKQRADDNEETIKNRIQVYRQQTQPAIDYYREKGVLNEIDASGGVQEVFEKIKQIMVA